MYGGKFAFPKSIGLACSRCEENLPFLLCFSLYLRANSKYKPSQEGAYIRRGDLTEGFLRCDFGGLISGGAYTWRDLFSEFYGMYIQHMTHAQFRWKTINYMKKVPYEVHASISYVASVERGRGNLIDVGLLVQKNSKTQQSS